MSNGLSQAWIALTSAIDTPMADATTENTEGKRPKRKVKGKQKETGDEEELEGEKLPQAPKGYVKVDNKGRCALCQKDGTICEINLPRIEQCREDLESGKATRLPVGLNCWRCKHKKKKCELPAVELLRELIAKLTKAAGQAEEEERKVSVTPPATATSSSKRTREVFAGVELPAPKRLMTKMAPPSSGFTVKSLMTTKTAEELQRELLGAVVGLGRQMSEVAAAVRASTAVQQRQGDVLHALLVSLVKEVAPRAIVEDPYRPPAPIASGSRSRAREDEREAVEVPIEDATGMEEEEDSGPRAEMEVTELVAGKVSDEEEEGSEEL